MLLWNLCFPRLDQVGVSNQRAARRSSRRRFGICFGEPRSQCGVNVCVSADEGFCYWEIDSLELLVEVSERPSEDLT